MATTKASRRRRRIRSVAAVAMTYAIALVTGFAAFVSLVAFLGALGSHVGRVQGQPDWLLLVALVLLAVPSAAIGSICGRFIQSHLNS